MTIALIDCVTGTVKGGEGFKNVENLRDVINGWSLTTAMMNQAHFSHAESAATA